MADGVQKTEISGARRVYGCALSEWAGYEAVLSWFILRMAPGLG